MIKCTNHQLSYLLPMLTTSFSSDAKRRKPTNPPKAKPSIGGLRPDAKKILYKKPPAAVSSTSLISNGSEVGPRTSEDSDEQDLDDFNRDESAASLTAARAMKQSVPLKGKSKVSYHVNITRILRLTIPQGYQQYLSCVCRCGCERD